mgnify:CR=1 FL=1
MVNPTGFPSFPWPKQGGKGGGDFLFKADQREAALWLPLFPLPAAAIFFLLLFLLEVALHDRKLQRVL